MAVAQTEEWQRTSTEPAGLDISIRTGTGDGSTMLSAFDAALQRAGVADFNLITLSSVIPTGSSIRTVDSPLPGGHGDLLFCVRAEAFAERPGQNAWAGLGWCVDPSGGGLFVEHHGDTEASVVDQIRLSLGDMNVNRGGGYGPVSVAVASAQCVDLPVCALVLAAYRVSSWHEPSPDAPAAATHTRGRAGAARAERSAHHGDHGPRRTPTPTLTGVPSSEPGVTEPPLVAPAGPSGIRVSLEKEVDYSTARRYYQLYRTTFGALETQAVARQVLHESEFLEEMLDPRVHKYVAWDDDDRVIGMSTLTSDLDAVPWISPAYFAHHYPEQSARGAVYYLGFALVDPASRGAKTFHAMIKPMIEVIAAAQGVVAVDMCLVNEERGLYGSGVQFLQSLANVSIEPIDRQTYYAGIFHGPGTTGVSQ